MHLTIDKPALTRLLARGHGIAERRNTIPILSNVKLEASGGRLHATATDMDIEATSDAAAEIHAAGSCTAPAHALHDIARRLPDGAPIELRHDGEAQRLTLRCGRSRFQLATLPAEDFPVFAAIDGATHFDLPAAALAAMIDRTRFAVSTEETRYYLGGIYLHVDGDQLVAVATDGHRLALASAPLPEGAAAMPAVIVPRKAVTEMRKLLDGAAEVELAVSDSRLRLAAGGAVLATKLIDGTFPDYRRVVPEGGDGVLEADSADLAAALDRVTAIAADKTRAVKLSLAADGMALAATDAEGGSASDSLDPERCAYTGPARDIGFNGRYLADILAAADANRVTITTTDIAGPARITIPGDAAALFVLMPMRI